MVYNIESQFVTKGTYVPEGVVMFLDMTLSTFGWVLLTLVANCILWGRAITIESEKIERVLVAIYTVVMLLFLAVAACFLMVMKPTEIAVSLVAWTVLIGAILTTGATGLLYAKYSR